MSGSELDPRCPLCRGLRPRGWPENWDCLYVGEKIDLYWFPTDIAILPAQPECSFCSLIRTIVDHLCLQGNHAWPTTLPIRGAPIKKEPARGNDGGSMELFRSRPYSLSVELRPEWPLRDRDIDIYLQDPSKQLPWLRLQHLPASPLRDTGSPAAVEWVKSRLARCAKAHKVCNQQLGAGAKRRKGRLSKSMHAATQWVQSRLSTRTDAQSVCNPQEEKEAESTGVRLPKRVLDIGSYPTVRLVETAGQVSDYACLSHCWGGSIALTTETFTLGMRLDGIEWEQLPKTFQEAMTFVHQLGIRYLWIDSLCIIQDSEDDWLEQSGQMGDIYSGAQITIAATRAQDGSKGLFSCGESTMSWNNIPLILRERPSHPTTYNPTLQAFPLLQRAWVAQEVLLSRRIVHFCEGLLVFECMEGWSCTCDDDLRREHDSPGLKDPIWSVRPSGPNDITSRSFRIRALQTWRHTLLYYTALQLTFEKDRLPAISSLARRFAETGKFTYAAGLWLEDLYSELLWHHSGNHSPAPRNAASTAPSWSWASTTGKVSFYACDAVPSPVVYCSLVSVDCIPLSPRDPYGQLRSAWLVLSAYLLPFRLWHKAGTRHFRAYHDGKGGIKVSLDIAIEYGEDSWTPAPGQWDYYGMPITRTGFTPRMDNDSTLYTCFGLVLRRNKGEGEFERVGLWECSSEHGYYGGDPDEWSGEKLHVLLEGMEQETAVIV